MKALLLRLLGMRADEVTGLAGADLAFRGAGLGWLVLGLLVVGGLSFWSYRLSPVGLPAWRRRLLTALRVVFLGLLLLMFLRPVLALTVEGGVRRLLLLLVDGSSSMKIEDPRVESADKQRAAIARNLIDPARGLGQELGPAAARAAAQMPRLEVIRSVLKNESLNLLPRLDREFDLGAFSFGQGVVELSAKASSAQPTNGPPQREESGPGTFPWVDRLEASSPVTALGDALREVLNRKRGQPLAGVVLMTDGVNNSGMQPVEAASLLRQEGVPLYVYGVGITRPRDIIVANLFAPEVTFIRDEVTVTVRVRSQGLAGQSAKVQLSLGGQPVTTADVQLSDDGEQTVPLRFIPQAEGEFELEASVAPRPGEAVSDNNRVAQRLRVVDARIKVLLAEQSPRWEFRYLQAMLLRDRRVELKCFLAEGDPAIARVANTPYLPEFPARKEDLFRFDVVILGDLDPRQLGAAQIENLGEWVSRFGGALVVLAGKRFCPQAYRRGTLDRLLPVEFDAARGEGSDEGIADKPITLQLTAAGKASPMLQLSDDASENERLWSELPPVYWVARVLRPKPAAEVLLVDPDPARESRFGKMPVVALQQYGLGQVLFVGTDNMWRWRKNAGDFYHTALWGQIIQRVSLARLLGISKRTQLSTDRQSYTTGERVTLYARLYSAGFEPVQDPAVKGAFALKNGTGRRTEVTLRPVPGQPGLYRGEFSAPTAGEFQFGVETDPDARLEFTVTEPKFEFGQTAMNEPLLRELAAATGGGFFREEDLHRLPEAIRARTERVRSPLEIELWCSPAYFLLLLAVVSVEWVLRKTSHLK